MTIVPSPSLARPPIDRLPAHDPPNALDEFLHQRVRGWGSAPVRLPAVFTFGLWVLIAFDIGLGGWLLAVHSGTALCSGLVCTVVTLGGHPTFTLVLAGVAVGVLLAAMPLTRGYTEAGGPLLVVVTAAGLFGVCAVSGVVAVLVPVALSVGVALGVFVVVIGRL